MLGKKLTKLLQELSPEEFRRLRKLFQSPIYTSHADHLKCYDYLRKYYPDFDSPRLQKEVIFKKMWKGQNYDDWKLRNLFREMTRLTEDYLILLEQEQCKWQRKKQLVNIYGRRNMYDFFEKGTKSLLASLEALPYRGKDYYLQKAQLNEAWYFHPLKNKYDIKDTTFEEGSNSIDQYFVHLKIQYSIALKAQQKILNTAHQLRFLEVIKAVEETDWIKNQPLLHLQYLSLRLLEQPTTIDFSVYDQLLFTHLAKLRLAGQKLFFTNGLNYLIGQATTYPEKFNPLVFQWYQKGLAHQLLMNDGHLAAAHFTNMVTYACLNKAFDWALEFIQTHQKKLPLNDREAMACFNTAKWHYYQKKFEAALTLLATCKVPLAYDLSLKDLEIRILFELFLEDYCYHELLLAKIKAFGNYIRTNKKFAAPKISPYKNYLKVVRVLTNRLINKEATDKIRSQVFAQLEKTSNMIGKQWLLEKLEGLE